jgi:hypothetical protein
MKTAHRVAYAASAASWRRRLAQPRRESRLPPSASARTAFGENIAGSVATLAAAAATSAATRENRRRGLAGASGRPWRKSAATAYIALALRNRAIFSLCVFRKTLCCTLRLLGNAAHQASLSASSNNHLRHFFPLRTRHQQAGVASA